ERAQAVVETGWSFSRGRGWAGQDIVANTLFVYRSKLWSLPQPVDGDAGRGCKTTHSECQPGGAYGRDRRPGNVVDPGQPHEPDIARQAQSGTAGRAAGSAEPARLSHRRRRRVDRAAHAECLGGVQV